MHGLGAIPVRFRDVEDHAFAEDAGVVDEDVEAAEGIEGGLDDALGAGEGSDGVVVGDGRPAGVADGVHDLIGGVVGAIPLARDGSAEVVDDDLGALGGEEERLAAADAPAGAGDDRDAALESGAPGVGHGASFMRVSCAVVARAGRPMGESRGGSMAMRSLLA